MNRWIFFGFAMALAPLAMSADTLGPQDFAYGLPIVISGEAAAYRLEIPVEVYRVAVSEGLADIRVFNAQGEVVPYALRDAPAETHAPSAPLPLFPLRAEAPVLIGGVRVTIDSPNSQVRLQTQHAGANAGGMAQQYIVDARGIELPIAAFVLNWPDSHAEYSGRIRIEASDDLGAWRSVVPAAPIANLEANGQQLIERRVELPRIRAKYWRLSWIGALPPFELDAVIAEPAGILSVTRNELDVTGVADPERPDDTVFDLGAHLRVDRVNLLLPEVNTVIAMQLQSRARPQDPWRDVVRAGFYRLNTAGGEQSNGPVAIEPDNDRYWRTHPTATGNSQHGPMHLQLSWIPNDIVFLPRGAAPFELAYGSAAAGRADADFASIPASIPVAAAAVGRAHPLGGTSRLTAVAAPFPTRRAVLWAILLAGVCILSLMAYRLVKDGAKQSEPE